MDWSKVERLLSGQPSFRLKQAKKAVFLDLVESWDKVSVFPQELKIELSKKCPLEIDGQIFSQENSFGVRKAMLVLKDGARIETVLMERAGGKKAVCLSCQAGCSLGCVFCATGRSGFQRNLTFEEIISQALFWQRVLKKEGQGKITHAVFMGMGEPFLNYDQTKKAILFLNDKETFNLGQRKISVSTAGLIEGIKKFSQENWQVNLAFSLHFIVPEKRAEFMPIEKSQSLAEVLKEIRAYLEKNRRKVMIEYVLFDKLNDSPEEAALLAQKLKKELGKLFMVNLIAGNPVGEFKSSGRKAMDIFRQKLEEAGVETSCRFRLGRNIQGACGQLAAKQSGI